MRITFFKTQRPNQFEYKARYYDPEKEKREKRKRQLGISDKDNRMERKEILHEKWKRTSFENKKHRAGVNVWVFLFIAALLTIVVLIIL